MQTILAVFRDCSVPGSVNLGTKGTCSKFSSLDFMPCFARFFETPASPFNPTCMLWEAIIIYMIITPVSDFTKIIALLGCIL